MSSNPPSANTVWTPAIKLVKDSTHPDDEYHAAHRPTDGSKTFRNPWPSWQPMNQEALMQHAKQRKWLSTWTHPSTSKFQLPVSSPAFSSNRLDTGTQDLRATWLGHACYFVEFPSGLRALFDPVMTDRCSPLSFLGPKRFTKTPCQIADIPIIDIVVISHNHYDHLSHPTVKDIHKIHPRAHFFVPQGNKEWFKSSGIEAVTELDWWEEVDFELEAAIVGSSANTNGGGGTGVNSTRSSTTKISARISCLPSQHTTGRGPFGTDQTLWASWGVRSPADPSVTFTSSSEKAFEGGDAAPTSTLVTASVYFAGDTGYRAVPVIKTSPKPPTSNGEKRTEIQSSQDDSDHDDHDQDWSSQYSHLPVCPAFSQIGQLRGPFDLGLLPIGAYEPRALMSSVHANPRDAVEILRDTRCVRALAMHWGTWVLGDEDVSDPPKRLIAALKVRGIPEKGVFDVCNVGESIHIKTCTQ